LAEAEVGNLKAKVSLSTVEFNKNVKAMESQFRIIDEQFKQASSGLDKVKDAMQLASLKSESLAKKIEIQTDVVKQLNDAHKVAVDRYGETSKKALDLELRYEKSKTALKGLESELSKTNAEIKNQGVTSEETERRVKALGDTFDSAGKKINQIGKVMTVALAGAAAAMGKMLSDSFQNADEIQKTAEVYGMTAEQVQELTYVGTKLDVELETITKAQSLLTKNMFLAKGGTGAQADAFKELGVNVVDGNKKLKDSKTVMGEVFTALGKMKNETERDALSMKIFGKSAMELNPLINAGGDEINRLTGEAHKMGAVLSNETIGALDKTGDDIEAAKLKITGLFGEMSIKLLPTIDDLSEKLKTADLTPLINGFTWVVDHAQEIATGVGVVYGGLALIKGVLLAIKISEAFQTLSANMVASGLTADALKIKLAAVNTGLLGIAALGIIEVIVVFKYMNDAKKAVEAQRKQVEDQIRLLDVNQSAISNMTPEQAAWYAEASRQLQASKDAYGGGEYVSPENWQKGFNSAFPGFASGVKNWQGGLARVNENGGEIQYLPKGTTVIPNDISMQIARSIGQNSSIDLSAVKSIVHEAIKELSINFNLGGVELQGVIAESANGYKRRTGRSLA
jgi:uncharacterized membrane protein